MQPDANIGQIIDGRYLLLNRLNSSASGVLYLAEEIIAHRDAHIRLMNPNADAVAIEELRRDVVNLKGVDDVYHFVQYVFGVTPTGQAYAAFDLPAGKSMAELIAEGPLSVDDAVDYLCQLGTALSSPHESGLVHRGLCPSSIVVAKKARGGQHLKILDFGLLRLESPSRQSEGTADDWQYMSPEWLAGSPVDTRADIYAIGVLAFEMLTARPAGAGPLRPGKLNSVVPEWLNRLVAEMTEPKVDRRLATVEQLLQRLKKRRGFEDASTSIHDPSVDTTPPMTVPAMDSSGIRSPGTDSSGIRPPATDSSGIRPPRAMSPTTLGPPAPAAPGPAAPDFPTMRDTGPPAMRRPAMTSPTMRAQQAPTIMGPAMGAPAMMRSETEDPVLATPKAGPLPQSQPTGPFMLEAQPPRPASAMPPQASQSVPHVVNPALAKKGPGSPKTKRPFVAIGAGLFVGILGVLAVLANQKYGGKSTSDTNVAGTASDAGTQAQVDRSLRDAAPNAGNEFDFAPGMDAAPTPTPSGKAVNLPEPSDALVSAGSLPQLRFESESGYTDLVFEIRSATFNERGDCQILAFSRFESTVVGFGVFIRAGGRAPIERKDEDPQVFYRENAVAFQSMGPMSDSLLGSMANIYSVRMPAASMKAETWFTAAAEQGSPRQLDTRQVTYRISYKNPDFFGEFAELYLRVQIADNKLSIIERDASNRQGVIKAISTRTESAP